MQGIRRHSYDHEALEKSFKLLLTDKREISSVVKVSRFINIGMQVTCNKWNNVKNKVFQW